jgi:hypothetical protein
MRTAPNKSGPQKGLRRSLIQVARELLQFFSTYCRSPWWLYHSPLVHAAPSRSPGRYCRDRSDLRRYRWLLDPGEDFRNWSCRGRRRILSFPAERWAVSALLPRRYWHSGRRSAAEPRRERHLILSYLGSWCRHSQRRRSCRNLLLRHWLRLRCPRTRQIGRRPTSLP